MTDDRVKEWTACVEWDNENWSRGTEMREGRGSGRREDLGEEGTVASSLSISLLLFRPLCQRGNRVSTYPIRLFRGR